jgi:hypothetical protein
MTERNLSPAYTVLRASARRVDRLIQSEIERQGGAATIYNDHLELCGSRRVWRPAMSELHALGLVEVVRFPKRYACRPSYRWREVTSQQAQIISVMAREHANDAEPC